MGTENIGLIVILGFMAFVSNCCYMAGGTEGFGLWWRRFLGSFILACSANLAAIYLHVWTWQYLLVYPSLILGFSLGYGADAILVKCLKRTVFALGVVSTLVLSCVIHQWDFSSLIVLLCGCLTGLTSVILGVYNPLKNAPAEQFLVSQVLTLFIPFIAFIN